MFYEACEYCPIFGEARLKTLPFGNKDGTIVVVVPNFARLTDEQRRDLEIQCPEAYFLAFAACSNVVDIDDAERACGILLRNESRTYRKLLLYDSETLRRLFHIVGESKKEGGVAFSTYKGSIGDKNFYEEYKRINNDE